MNDISILNDSMNWAKNLYNKVDVDAWLRKIGITSPEIIKSMKYFLFAFFAGFLLKKYFRFVLWCCFIIIVLSVILNSKSILSINWENLKSLLSFNPAKTTIENLVVNSFDWVKNNLIVFIILSLSFLFGYKLG